MTKREALLATLVAVVVGGYVLLTFVIDPAIAAFDEVGQQTKELEQELELARVIADSERVIRRQWVGYELAGLARSFDQADAETGGALVNWAKDAGFDKVTLSNGKAKTDDELPFGEISYTLQTAGRLKKVDDLLCKIYESPFPLRLDKCVIDLRNDKDEDLQVTLTLSTLFTPEGGEK